MSSSVTMAKDLPLAAMAGFADPIHDAQATFRALLDAMARPGSIVSAPALIETGIEFAVTMGNGDRPAQRLLPPAMAAAVLALADQETAVWLDPPMAAAPSVADLIRFATGARIVTEPKAATFALIADPAGMPSLGHFALGTPEYPDRSTTVIMAVTCLDNIANDRALELTGPGIATSARLSFDPMPAHLIGELEANRARFPMGVDLILCTDTQFAALPRSARIREPV